MNKLNNTPNTQTPKTPSPTTRPKVANAPNAAAAAPEAALDQAAAAPDRPQAMSAPCVRFDIVVPGEEGLHSIVVELNADKAPQTVESFLEYVKEQHYDGTIFHRVIENFMVQGGGFTQNMRPKPALRTVQNEADNGLKNRHYTVAMARTQDPHSASAQFFINVADNEFLDHRAPSVQGWGYCVFGQVVKGQEIIDRIKSVKTGKIGFHCDVPLAAVVIKQATIL